GLEHDRRGHDAPVDRCARRLGIGVDGVGIADGLAPVPDHRLVDGIGADLGRPYAAALEGPHLLQEGVAHRGDRVIPRPTLATISRWTSLTPPPKVLTWAARAARSRSPCSTAP